MPPYCHCARRTCPHPRYPSSASSTITSDLSTTSPAPTTSSSTISIPARSYTTRIYNHLETSSHAIHARPQDESTSSIAVHDPSPKKCNLAQRPLQIPRPSKSLHGVARWEAKTLALINASRLLHGVQPLRISNVLGVVARRHNADQAFLKMGISHVGSDGAGLGDRLRRVGYDFRYAAENVAAGQNSPRHVHRSLMKSEGHRRNLLSDRIGEMGMHVGRGTDGRLYWTQVFGKKKQ